jgi:hypothetical protein
MAHRKLDPQSFSCARTNSRLIESQVVVSWPATAKLFVDLWGRKK